MQVIDLKELYAYHSWATGRIMEKTLQTTSEQFTAAGGASYDSLQRTLVHMVSAEWIWRMRCQEGVSPVAVLEANDFPTPRRWWSAGKPNRRPCWASWMSCRMTTWTG